MQDEQQDILYRAAEVWKELTEYHYVFTYGYKGELHEIKLTFSPEDFPHLAGFHYLKDIALPRYSPRKTVDMILSGKITYDKVKKGTLYQEYVKPRLLALVRLKEILEQDFDLFSYAPILSVRDQNQSGLPDFQPNRTNCLCVHYPGIPLWQCSMQLFVLLCF